MVIINLPANTPHTPAKNIEQNVVVGPVSLNATKYTKIMAPTAHLPYEPDGITLKILKEENSSG